MSADGTPLFCDEHGEVMRVGELKAPPGIAVGWAWFCPICDRELSRRDLLSEIERDGQPAPTFDEWKAAQTVPVLEIDARKDAR